MVLMGFLSWIWTIIGGYIKGLMWKEYKNVRDFTVFHDLCNSLICHDHWLYAVFMDLKEYLKGREVAKCKPQG